MPPADDKSPTYVAIYMYTHTPTHTYTHTPTHTHTHTVQIQRTYLCEATCPVCRCWLGLLLDSLHSIPI